MSDLTHAAFDEYIAPPAPETYTDSPCEVGHCVREAVCAIWFEGRWTASCRYHAELFDL